MILIVEEVTNDSSLSKDSEIYESKPFDRTMMSNTAKA